MRARPLAEPPVARRATGRMSGLRCMLLLAAAFCILGCVWASDTPSKEERERSNFSYIHKDLRRPQQYGMSTLADYPQLLAEDDDGQIIKTPETTEVPLDLPTIVLSDILPSTGFLVARDKFTNTILSNSTAFFVASDVVITAAHSVAPLLRRFHVNLQIITNSRTSGGSRTFNVTSIAYDNVNAPCQVLLQVRTVSNHFPRSTSPCSPPMSINLVLTPLLLLRSTATTLTHCLSPNIPPRTVPWFASFPTPPSDSEAFTSMVRFLALSSTELLLNMPRLLTHVA